MTTQSTHPAPPEQLLEPFRFVFLEHDYPTLHWDILLQQGNRLLGWRGDNHGHFLNGGHVVQTSDHRLVYLDYEGPLTGQRGTVKRVDAGRLTWRHCAENEFIAEIQGKQWHGVLELKKIDATKWFSSFTFMGSIEQPGSK